MPLGHLEGRPFLAQPRVKGTVHFSFSPGGLSLPDSVGAFSWERSHARASNRPIWEASCLRSWSMFPSFLSSPLPFTLTLSLMEQEEHVRRVDAATYTLRHAADVQLTAIRSGAKHPHFRPTSAVALGVMPNQIPRNLCRYIARPVRLSNWTAKRPASYMTRFCRVLSRSSTKTLFRAQFHR